VPWKKHQEYDTSLKYNVQPKVKSFFEINQTGKRFSRIWSTEDHEDENWSDLVFTNFTGDTSSLTLKNKVLITSIKYMTLLEKHRVHANQNRITAKSNKPSSSFDLGFSLVYT
jgi:hypothetical protein